ncbi:unnamed protein product [Sphenostylis stenocarpa]|uniref:Uncharacterized protein n=1 Tax=Sphenostylis stenocarpa TaxID=92480 RepID=A0AA86VRT8_9FABA|nr:unnamed protein product [Sphenostylis stenocarpa]
MAAFKQPARREVREVLNMEVEFFSFSFMQGCDGMIKVEALNGNKRVNRDLLRKGESGAEGQID